MSEINKRMVKQARWLTQGLILSGALNIGLLLAFFCFLAKESINKSSFEYKPIDLNNLSSSEKIVTNREVLEGLEKLSFDELLVKLNDTALVEDGLTERDLGLATLVSAQHFNLTKALPQANLQPRQLVIHKGGNVSPTTFMLFSGLSDEDYNSIIQYAKTEKWPLTSKGLFLQIKYREKDLDPSLAEAFYLSPEFMEVDTLFATNGLKDKARVLQMLQEGEWQTLGDFAKSQKETQDLSPARLQRTLLDYIEHHSKTSAEIMLENYGAYAVKKLDDAHVLTMLEILKEKNAHSEAFAKALLISPRSDAVWRQAAARLYEFSGVKPPEKYDHMQALKQFIPEDTIKEKTRIAKAVLNKSTPPSTKPIAPKKNAKPIEAPKKKAQETKAQEVKVKSKKTHVVQDGETLWIIAKKYKVDIAALKTENKLTSDTIRVGKTLTIPNKD